MSFQQKYYARGMGQCAAVTLSNAAQQEELSLLRFSSKAGRGGGGSGLTERLNIYTAVACSRQCTSSSMDLNQTNIRTHFGAELCVCVCVCVCQ